MEFLSGFKEWLEETGSARIEPDPLISPDIRIQITGDGGVPTYDAEIIKRKKKNPEKLFGVKKVEK